MDNVQPDLVQPDSVQLLEDMQPDLLEKIRQQFDNAPYPKIPLDQSPKDSARYLYFHNIVTPFYVRDGRVIETEGKVILDAGCGSGYKSLALAEANPGAKIVGVDLSEESAKLSEQRLKHHGFEDAEFYARSIYDLADLNIQFDYIHCDEVLYLLPDPVAGLKAMRSVLKPDGIIRANLHSSLQRVVYFRGQEFFIRLGLTGEADQDTEVSTVRNTIKALKDHVFLRNMGWKPAYETEDELILANYLLRGDKGYTIPEFFAALRAADLSFISMVEARQWNLMNLFEDIQELPIEIAMGIAEKSIEEQLHLFELIQPLHRLLDLWCGHPRSAEPLLPLSEWQSSDWRQAIVHLHPQLKTAAVKQDIESCVTNLQMFQMSQHLPISEETVRIDSLTAACLLPLWQAPCQFSSLVDHLLKIRPLNPTTLEPSSQEDAFELIKQMVMRLEEFGYLLVEGPASGG